MKGLDHSLWGALQFPIAGYKWSDFSGQPYVKGADEGAPGYGGWRFPRSPEHLHRGIDLHVPAGTKLVSVARGEIEMRFAYDPQGQFSYAGHRIILTHANGATFKYFHLGTSNNDPSDAFANSFDPKKRHFVEAGQVLGSVGFTGGNKAKQELLEIRDAHLHFEYYPLGEAKADVNPARFFEAFDLD